MCYLLIYCGMCYLVFICIYVYNMWKGKDIIDEEPKVKIMFFIVVPPLIAYFVPGIFYFRQNLEKKRNDKK